MIHPDYMWLELSETLGIIGLLRLPKKEDENGNRFPG